MQPIRFTAPSTTLIPPLNREAVATLDLLPFLLSSLPNSAQPLPKNIYLLLDNSYSMNSSRTNIVEFITAYFDFLNTQAANPYRPHQVQGSLFGTKSTAVPDDGKGFLPNLLSVFDAEDGGTVLAPGLGRVLTEWLVPIDPSAPYDNLLILITDGANQDGNDVKQMREPFINLLKIKNVALFVFGLGSPATASSTLENFTNLKDEASLPAIADSSLKVHYVFIENLARIPEALRILKGYRTVLKQGVLSLSSPIGIELRVVGYPCENVNNGYPHSDVQQVVASLGSATTSDLASLCLSIQGRWPQPNEIQFYIEGTDPITGTKFGSQPLALTLPTQPQVHGETLLLALPILSREARKRKNRQRQMEILTTIRLLKQEYGETPLLLENERYLTNAIQAVPVTEEDALLDALNSLSI